MKESIRIICESPDKVQLPPDADQLTRAQMMAEYIKANVTDPDALELMNELAATRPDPARPDPGRVARKNGIEHCPLAELR